MRGLARRAAVRRTARVRRVRKRTADVTIWRNNGPGHFEEFGGARRRSERRTCLAWPCGRACDRDRRSAFRRFHRVRGADDLNLGKCVVAFMVRVSGGMRGQMAVNGRALVMAPLAGLIRVHMQERRRSRVDLHTEAHEQDEAEPLHVLRFWPTCAGQSRQTARPRVTAASGIVLEHSSSRCCAGTPRAAAR